MSLDRHVNFSEISNVLHSVKQSKFRGRGQQTRPKHFNICGSYHSGWVHQIRRAAVDYERLK